MKKNLLIVSLLLAVSFIDAQEALKTDVEDYYEFLSLSGLVDRPTLNFRTLSDNVWIVPDTGDSVSANVWAGNNLGSVRTLGAGFSYKVYGPDLFASFNTAAPYGQNDGALWQGKGLNSSLTAGFRLQGHGLELTVKPQVCFSQNLDFDIVSQNYYESEYGYVWGYGNSVGADAPQRFGDKAFFTYDWGDTEIRYTWKTLTVGFGTQAIWLGPGKINSILHSNNAPTYPKFDFGIRKQAVHLFGQYLGDVEARIWVGYLSESDYFDSDESNDHNMINGLALAYAPSFIPGLTLSANRTCLTKWDWSNLKYMLVTTGNSPDEDQKASLGASWVLPPAGLEIYGEIGVDDYVVDLISYPFHTLVYTAGLTKTFTIAPEKKIYGELQFECTSLEMSQDFQLQWNYSFYFHGKVSQGYTNGGQWLGAGNGTGGNSQYLAFKLYYPKGSSTIYLHRSNPDNDYLYNKAVYAIAEDPGIATSLEALYHSSWKVSFLIGLSTQYFITPSCSLSGGFAYDLIHNAQYKTTGVSETLHNFRFTFGAKYQL